ncbi:MAG: hypothetical protein ABIK28_05715 [Planctomycetota bacterium]
MVRSFGRTGPRRQRIRKLLLLARLPAHHSSGPAGLYAMEPVGLRLFSQAMTDFK